MADFTTFIGPATKPEPRPDPGTIGPPRSDYAQPKHEQVMTGAALSALAATNPATALPMAAKLGHDLALDGAQAFADPSNVAALAGIMTYGASSVRMGANRARMQRMAARGEPLPKIRRATGYEPGPFGMGAETRGDATLRPTTLLTVESVEGELGKLGYVHPDLERAYPGISKTNVHIVPDSKWAETVRRAEARMSDWSRGRTATGFTSPDGVFLRGKTTEETVRDYLDRVDRTLVHELQHVAQTRDGLRPPRVHATQEEYTRDAREVDARNSAERSSYLPQERELIPRRVTQDVAPEDVQQDAKGGDNFALSRNFLATDEVPETIFGIPVVQDGYSEADAAFFRDNPKAAGFYEMGDEEVDEGTPQQDDDGGETIESLLVGPDFDIDAMAADAVSRGLTAKDALEQFYGDQTERILKEADEARRSIALTQKTPTPALNPGLDPRSTAVTPAHEDPSSVMKAKSLDQLRVGMPGAGMGALSGKFVEPSWWQKHFGTVRSSADPIDGSVVIYRGHEDSWAHELFGHIFNPYVIDEKDKDRLGASSPAYYIGNFAEYAAAVGNLRKALFKKSNGKVDIADPKMLKRVVDTFKKNREVFSGKWMSKDARMFLEAVTKPWPEPLYINNAIEDRRRKTDRESKDATSLRQFVRTGPRTSVEQSNG